MNDYLDLYCERGLPGFWSEPFNTISNVAFFVAAWAIWQLARQQQNRIPSAIWGLIGLTLSIGIGSTLFHTMATRWASALDVLFILLFQLWFLWLYSRRIIRLHPGYVGVLIIGFYFTSQFSQQFPSILNGSLSYVPAWIVLLGLGLYHWHHKQQEPWILLGAAVTFLVALTFRTLDQLVCPQFEIGTHFLWHGCNGLLLYFSTRGLILNWTPRIVTQPELYGKNNE